MELPLWGSLEKSLDDTETIEQAIARLISEHEEAPTAHLGAGESLASHKAEDVIDHPVGSVLADKTTLTENELYDSFASIDAWTASSGTIQNVGYSLQVNKVVSVGTVASAYATIPFWNFTDFDTLDSLAQFNASFFGSDSARLYAICFGTYYDSPQDGYGIIVDTGGVTLFVDRNGTRYYATEYTTFTALKNLYRIQFSSIDNTVRLYLNGDVIASMDMPSDVALEGDIDMNVYVTTPLATSASVRLSNLYVSQAI